MHYCLRGCLIYNLCNSIGVPVREYYLKSFKMLK